MLAEDVIDILSQARVYLEESDVSIVALDKHQIIGSNNDEYIKNFLELIELHPENLDGCVIGICMIDKASALLCRSINAKGVYAQRGTKKGIATLIVGGIPNQVDELVDDHDIRNDEFFHVERMVESIDTPDDVYHVLKNIGT